MTDTKHNSYMAHTAHIYGMNDEFAYALVI